MKDHVLGAHIASINLVVLWLSMFQTLVEIAIYIMMVVYLNEIVEIMKHPRPSIDIVNSSILELCAYTLELELVTARKSAALSRISIEIGYRIIYLGAAILVIRAITITSHKWVWPWILVTIFGIVNEIIVILVGVFKFKPVYVLLKLLTMGYLVIILILARGLYEYLWKESPHNM